MSDQLETPPAPSWFRRTQFRTRYEREAAAQAIMLDAMNSGHQLSKSEWENLKLRSDQIMEDMGLVGMGVTVKTPSNICRKVRAFAIKSGKTLATY